MTCADELGHRVHPPIGTPLGQFAKHLHRSPRADEIGRSDLHCGRARQHQFDGAPAICHTPDADNWQVTVRFVDLEHGSDGYRMDRRAAVSGE